VVDNNCGTETESGGAGEQSQAIDMTLAIMLVDFRLAPRSVKLELDAALLGGFVCYLMAN